MTAGILGHVAEKPRILQNSRDMLLSLIPLAILCIIIAGVAGQCDFSPGRPTPGAVPEFHPEKELPRDAKRLDFPIRLPVLPDDWTANSGRLEPVPNAGDAMLTAVGYVTSAGRYIELIQSDATEEQLLRAEQGEGLAARSETVAGHTWVVYQHSDGSEVWIADLGNVRVVITPKVPSDDVPVLAEAVLAADPLPSD